MFSALIWASNVCLDGKSTQSKLTQNYSFSYGDYKWISNIRKLWNPNAQNFTNAQKYYVYFKCMLKIHSSPQLCINIHFLVSERSYISSWGWILNEWMLDSLENIFFMIFVAAKIIMSSVKLSRILELLNSVLVLLLLINLGALCLLQPK